MRGNAWRGWQGDVMQSKGGGFGRRNLLEPRFCGVFLLDNAMADNLLIPWSGRVILTTAGAPAAGALITIYAEDTLDLLTLYSDRDLTVTQANPVTCDANGLAPMMFLGTTAYKIKITTSAGVAIDEEDDLPGALDTSGFSATFSKPDTDVDAHSSDHTVVSGDLGKILNCNPTGGTFSITLISAVTAGNGKGVGIRHNGTANVVKIVTVSSQTIGIPGDVTTTAFCLYGRGHFVWLTSDGANWVCEERAPPLIAPNGGAGAIIIKDRISSAPSSSPGSRYIVTSAYSTFEQEDIIEDTGQGTWFEYTPAEDCGWIAYVQDENIYYYFRGTAWVAENASDTQIGTIEIAVQAEMEAASSTTLAVTPGRTHFHPGVAKAWAQIVGAGTGINADYGVASITDNGTGDLTVTVDTAFSATTHMVPMATVEDTTEAVCIRTIGGGAMTTTTVRFLSEVGSTGTDQDPVLWFVTIHGDL